MSTLIAGSLHVGQHRASAAARCRGRGRVSSRSSSRGSSSACSRGDRGGARTSAGGLLVGCTSSSTPGSSAEVVDRVVRRGRGRSGRPRARCRRPGCSPRKCSPCVSTCGRAQRGHQLGHRRPSITSTARRRRPTRAAVRRPARPARPRAAARRARPGRASRHGTSAPARRARGAAPGSASSSSSMRFSSARNSSLRNSSFMRRAVGRLAPPASSRSTSTRHVAVDGGQQLGLSRDLGTRCAATPVACRPRPASRCSRMPSTVPNWMQQLGGGLLADARARRGCCPRCRP